MIFTPRRSRNFYLAFDLGTASVSAALFSMGSAKRLETKPHIEEVYRSVFDVSQGLSAHDLLRHTLRGMREIIERSSKKIGTRPREILIGLSAPFYLSQTVQLRLDRPNARAPVSADEEAELIKKAESEVIASTHVSARGSIRFFSQIPVRIHINGYPVKKPIGTAGRRLEILIRLEAISTLFELQLARTIHRLGTAIPTRIASAPCAQTRALGLALAMAGNLLLVDIGSEVTELSLIRDGVLEKVISLPHGSGALVRAVAEALTINFHDALFLLRRLSETALEVAVATRVTALVRKFVASWRELVAGELAVCLQDGFAPTRIFITGGGSLLLQYRDSFSNPDFGAIPLRQLEISVVQPASLQDFFENAPAFGGPEDFTLACLVLLLQADSHLPALIDSDA